MEASIELRELKPFEEEKEVSLEDKVRGYVQAIKDIEKSEKGLFKRKRAVKEFVGENPSETDDLVDYYKSKAGVVERATTWGKKTRVQKAVREYEISQNPSAVKRFIKRHPVVLPSILATQGFISLLSPSHPLMVDAYLAGRGIGIVSEMIAGPKVSDEELRGFLTTKEQALKYESDVIKDLEDLDSEKVFSIVEKDGKLEQKDVRTMNFLISKYLPFLNLSSDNNGIPRLDDKVDLWLQGYEHVASGHYHVFGEVPSQGDLLVSKIFPGREIVVVNGFVDKKVFMDGELVRFRDGIEISNEVRKYFIDFVGVGYLVPCNFEICNVGKDLDHIDSFDWLNSFLGYLSKVGGVDISNLDAVRDYILFKYEHNFRDFYDKKVEELNLGEGDQENIWTYRRAGENFYNKLNAEYDPQGHKDSSNIISIKENLKNYPGGYEKFLEDDRAGNINWEFLRETLRETIAKLRS